MNKNDLKEAITEVLVAERTVSEAQHRLDHDWVQDRRKRFKIRVDRWEKVRMTAIGTVVAISIGALLKLLWWLGELAIQAFKNGQGPNQ